MYVSRLALDHFRSWEHLVVDFTPGVNILQGSNGLGKTNLVEAVEVLSTGSSHRASGSLPLIERGQASAVIRANVNDSSPSETTTYELTVTARGANRARVNGGRSAYLRDVIGQVPSVSFTPEDQRLVAGDPASRRTLLNQAGALLVPGYPDRLQTITKIARQRAALLKQLGDGRTAANGRLDPGYGLPSPAEAALNGLEIWTGQFIETGVAITRDRRRLVDRLAAPFTEIYRELAGADEHAELVYEPSFEEIFLYPDPLPHISEHFQRIYPGEVARGQNLIGPHRDDLSLLLNGMPAREFASNGEMWTMALALKMALYEAVAADRGVKPIVILDDVFAQLDESRRRQILDFAARQDQVLITVAAASDIPDLDVIGGHPAHVIDVAALKREQDAYLHPDLSAFGIEVDS
ncbi:DNA replication/repair protein RecF [Bifidobacterium simiiventris]|uniref:DNA replication/repair protein RecF n=1 Tax=Bifidobacterium simiiventris TaxID=2834434 RepID=UPI001C5787EC|nr:DNA replication and repair protein RecF [Bifidobacterium simiiventris]MBW3079193.1 DNA replication and repair protein RecF [Bifidobacterium simiiventris]